MFFEQAAEDLGVYAAHAGRKMINESDVQCLMHSSSQPDDIFYIPIQYNSAPHQLRQRLINGKTNVESLAQRFLPRELSDLVCASALAANVLSIEQGKRPRGKRAKVEGEMSEVEGGSGSELEVEAEAEAEGGAEAEAEVSEEEGDG
ncbi:hypothetical protein BC938DRAFT_477732 [Jimgerdemannia flammicorona]|uniref:CENP-T/Histone H4 histone fold domain-containing protein n=1 Tax=Jimgerdemannia flammicorona TaxID=994334 RepID=A0A433QNX1_9FUNG|nr:hypothetical protein BC938DRAFT_477732 [Jimgerdemannia flammicorona]